MTSVFANHDCTTQGTQQPGSPTKYVGIRAPRMVGLETYIGLSSSSSTGKRLCCTGSPLPLQAPPPSQSSGPSTASLRGPSTGIGALRSALHVPHFGLCFGPSTAHAALHPDGAEGALPCAKAPTHQPGEVRSTADAAPCLRPRRRHRLELATPRLVRPAAPGTIVTRLLSQRVAAQERLLGIPARLHLSKQTKNYVRLCFSGTNCATCVARELPSRPIARW